jgi:F-type H+-transporting ATPase subunit epsilon
MPLNLEIVSVEGELYSDEAAAVVLPGQEGDMMVYPSHAPLLTSLRAGEVRVQNEGEEERSFYVSGGILEIQPQMVRVMSDTALRARDVDEAEAEEARQRAEQAMERASANADYARAEAELAEAQARLKLARKTRNAKA